MDREQNVRNDLLQDLEKNGRLNLSFLLLMAVAGTLTAIALLTNSVPVLIGAMVIAPTMPPLALAIMSFAGGQPKLTWAAIWTIVWGIAVAVLAAVAITWVFVVFGVVSLTPEALYRPLLEERVRPGWYSAVVALAAGMAAVLGAALKRVDIMIGVVAAVALVPASCAAGIAMVAGDSARALGALILLTVNLLLIGSGGLLTIVCLRKRFTDRDFAS